VSKSRSISVRKIFVSAATARGRSARPVKQAEMSSWRRVERVGEVAVGGSWAVGAVVLAIDIFVRVVGG
jgi:hypothetical protein